MSNRGFTVVYPGPARLTLVALFAIPAAMAYPWHTDIQRWILGVAVAVALLALSWWRGAHLSTQAWRRLAMLVPRRGGHGGARRPGPAAPPTRAPPRCCRCAAARRRPNCRWR
ncbi:hypothetical protein [Mycolicibacterium insubricum]|uniref:hypothetical protein n=1 Tax=Mycolicibacterium insubricum TaxID=444597 RepID=UPI0021F2EE3D|nr:hypothetical protein [Mycolicibacterium insubricum]MCV7082748.1 hypothetical protein [Mycolicibacterium insubricum]